MRKLVPFLSCLALPLVSIIMLACGSSSQHGQLQSITISPATADAQNFPNGQVQFEATGTYTDGTKVSPLAVLWWPNQPWTLALQTPVVISLDSKGVAACRLNSGTFGIWATAPVDPHIPLSQVTMRTPQVVATAQLTCP